MSKEIEQPSSSSMLSQLPATPLQPTSSTEARGATPSFPSPDIVQQLQQSAQVLQVQDRTRTQLIVSGGPLQQDGLGLMQVPSGIVDQRSAHYGPSSRGRTVVRTTLVETLENHKMRAEIARLREFCQRCEADIEQHELAAATAERSRVETIAERAFHEQRAEFENIARSFESEANTLRQKEVQREQMFADAKYNNTVHIAEAKMIAQQDEIIATEQRANQLSAQLKHSQQAELQAFEHA